MSKISFGLQIIRYLIQSPVKHSNYLKKWYKSLNSDSMQDGYPWILDEAIDWLQSKSHNMDNIFEWGSGGSTLFFSKFGKHVVSVEYDKKWFATVQEKIIEKKIDNVKLLLKEPQPLGDRIDVAKGFCSSSQLYNQHNFEEYVRVIENYPDQSFDLMVVDGRSRNGCIKYGMSKVKVGGYILLDNSDRVSYQEGKNLLHHWPSYVFYGLVPYTKFFCSTTIWQKI